jgi:uncharacterized protein YdeI (YjbR/CyaY-like superfamily)
MKQIYFKTSGEWREWLINNHNKEIEVWLIFYKKVYGKPSINYESAVEEALCFGWIDSIIKKIDDQRYVRKFTPRKDNSNWSVSNKKRVVNLIKNKRMTEIGLAKIEAAKKKGQWTKSDRPNIKFVMPEEFKSALDKNKKAKIFFNQLAPTHQKQFIGWIFVAKQKITKDKRIKESIALLAKGQKLGLK